MQAAPRFAQRRRALRWLVGGAGGRTLFGCCGGGEVDPQVAESALDATGPGASLFTKVVRGALLNGPPFPKDNQCRHNRRFLMRLRGRLPSQPASAAHTSTFISLSLLNRRTLRFCSRSSGHAAAAPATPSNDGPPPSPALRRLRRLGCSGRAQNAFTWRAAEHSSVSRWWAGWLRSPYGWPSRVRRFCQPHSKVLNACSARLGVYGFPAAQTL